MRAWGMALLLTAGCGLSDYEQKMQEAAARAARFDEQAKVLDQALLMPMAPAKAKMPPAALGRVFLRPPRGIGPRPAKEVRYGERHAYLPIKANAAAPFQEIEIAFGKKGDKDFHANLIKSIGPIQAGPTTPYTTRPPSGAGTMFARTVVDAGPLEYSVNTCRDEKGAQIAVIYCYDKAKRAMAQKPLDLSLETFAVNQAVDAAIFAFNSGGPLGAVPR